MDSDGDPLLNEVVSTLRHRSSHPKPLPPEIEVTDTENCNYLNDIAVCILFGVFILLFLLFTSRRASPLSCNKQTTINIPLFVHLLAQLLNVPQLLLLLSVLCKVLLVKETQTHVAIFSSRDEATSHPRTPLLPPAIGAELHGVHRTEGALHATDLLLRRQVVKQALPSHASRAAHLHLLRVRGRHIARLHTTHHHQLVQDG